MILGHQKQTKKRTYQIKLTQRNKKYCSSNFDELKKLLDSMVVLRTAKIVKNSPQIKPGRPKSINSVIGPL